MLYVKQQLHIFIHSFIHTSTLIHKLFFLKKIVLGIILKSNGTWGNGAVSVFKDTQLDLTGRA